MLFVGTVANTTDVARAARELPNVEVCGLGNCSTTDDLGVWMFEVPKDLYTGGEALFTLNRNGIVAEVVVPNLFVDSSSVAIDFLYADDGSTGVIEVTQDGMVTADNVPTDGMDDSNSDLNDLDESERACQIVERSNITTLDSVSMITSTNAADMCPQEIPAIITVANPGSIAFEYEITVDVGSITVAPLTGVLAPGESQTHDGAYLCDAEQSFDTLINARVTRYLPEGSDPILATDALEQCGPGVSTGNTIISEPIMVELMQ